MNSSAHPRLQHNCTQAGVGYWYRNKLCKSKLGKGGSKVLPYKIECDNEKETEDQ